MEAPDLTPKDTVAAELQRAAAEKAQANAALRSAGIQRYLGEEWIEIERGIFTFRGGADGLAKSDTDGEQPAFRV